MTEVIPFNKIKWTVFLTTGSSLSIFTQCIEKLASSVDPKRTEIILLGKQDNKLLLDTFSHFCEQKNIPYNYGDDTSHASEIARGQYLVFLTDHTIVSKQFLVKLAFAMENSDKQDNRTAVVAPTSNEAAPDLNITPYNIDALQAGLSRQQIAYAYTMRLSPFCIMVKKEAYHPGYNVRETILQANYDGYLTVSVNDCIVYHYPEDIDESISQSFASQDPKLAVLYRVKVDDEYIRDIFVESLTKASELTENIYIIDDNSKVKLGLFFKEKHPELWSKVKKYEKFSRPYDEKRDYNELIDWAEKDGCTWVLSMEADEIIEDKVNKEYLKRFLNPVNPEIFGYKVNHYHFYDSPVLWRVDSPWGKMQDIRLSRLFPGRRINKPGNVAGQCGYVPSLPEESFRECGIRFKNFGYVKPEARQQKYDFYTKLGIQHNNQKPDFSYLIQENGMHRYEWTENNTITFYTPVKNGGDILWSWLDSIAYFADEVLVGNDSNGLKQEDLELISLYPNAIVVPTVMADNFADGRNKVIKEAKSDWIFQLDVDERLDNLCGIRRFMDIPKFDCWMFEIINHQKSGQPIITRTIRLFRNKDGVEYWGRLHETIDAHIKKFGWRISRSPVKMSHHGFVIQSNDQAYEKMQRYLDINLKQMKENPWHGMSYYNVALHLLDDDLVEDAIKLLEICTFLQPTFPLAGIELGRNYLKKAHRWFNLSIPKNDKSNPVRQGMESILQQTNQLLQGHHVIARGHCISYFNIHADQREWLKDHILDMEKKIEEKKTEILEQRAKGK